MFKLVVLSALLAVAAARPSHLESPLVYSAPAATVAVHETSLAHVGNVVKSVPSAVSHHSNSVVHSHAHVVEDIVAPVVKTTQYTTKSLATPIVESYAAPAAVHTYAAAAPVAHYTYASAPAAVQTYAAAAPVLQKYIAAPEVYNYAAHYAASAPLSYTSTGLW